MLLLSTVRILFLSSSRVFCLGDFGIPGWFSNSFSLLGCYFLLEFLPLSLMLHHCSRERRWSPIYFEWEIPHSHFAVSAGCCNFWDMMAHQNIPSSFFMLQIKNQPPKNIRENFIKPRERERDKKVEEILLFFASSATFIIQQKRLCFDSERRVNERFRKQLCGLLIGCNLSFFLSICQSFFLLISFCKWSHMAGPFPSWRVWRSPYQQWKKEGSTNQE